MPTLIGSKGPGAQRVHLNKQPRTLVQLLVERALERPDVVFARFGALQDKQPLSYAAAWALACRWRTLFEDQGLRPGHVVHIALPNGPDFIGAYFGTLLARGIVAPMMPQRSMNWIEFADL